MNLHSFRGGKVDTFKIARIALMSAILYISQIALSFIPNCELVSCLIILMTLVFGSELFLVVTIFSTIEGATYGFGLWVVSYYYVWALLVLITLVLKKVLKDDIILWSVVSGVFGVIFGALFAIAYIPVSPSYAMSYWIAGIPWDLWHAGCNIIIMLIVGRPMLGVLRRCK